MADKNIQMKIKNGANWDNLFPKTKASITVLNDGTTVADALDNKVDKVSGKQLSTEDFTSTLKTKLNSLSNYTHPTGDGNLHVPATSSINNGKFLKAGSTTGSITWSAIAIADVANLQTEINKKANATDIYTKSQIDTKLSGVITDGNVYSKIVVGATEDKTADFWFQEI